MDSATLRRLIVTALGLVAVAANKKLGLDLGTTEIEGLAAIVVGYLAQSAYTTATKAKAAGEAAGASVTTAEQAKAVLLGEAAAADGAKAAHLVSAHNSIVKANES